MRVYIAYKYTHIPNKSELKINLEHIAHTIEAMGHETFILGRDIKKWGKEQISTIKNFFTIINQISNSDLILAYVASDVKSDGMLFELTIGRSLGKRTILALSPSVKKNTFKNMAHEIIEYSSLKDLEEKLEKALSQGKKR